MSLLSLFMNTEDKKNPNNWTQEERDRVVGFFDLLIKMDKEQNPALYKKRKDGENMVVLDGHGNEVTL